MLALAASVLAGLVAPAGLAQPTDDWPGLLDELHAHTNHRSESDALLTYQQADGLTRSLHTHKLGRANATDVAYERSVQQNFASAPPMLAEERRVDSDYYVRYRPQGGWLAYPSSWGARLDDQRFGGLLVTFGPDDLELTPTGEADVDGEPMRTFALSLTEVGRKEFPRHIDGTLFQTGTGGPTGLGNIAVDRFEGELWVDASSLVRRLRVTADGTKLGRPWTEDADVRLFDFDDPDIVIEAPDDATLITAR
jgi:hypothetical protein